MKVVTKTDEYTIYQRRDQRYAVKDAQRQWVNGDAKIAILVEHKLVNAAVAKPAPEPEPEPEASAAAEDAAETEAAADDAAAAEAPAAQDEPAADAAGDAEAEK